MNNNFNYGTFNNEKKWCKSHFLLYIVSFMFVMSAMLCINPDWLNKYYDTTLCATSTVPTIDSTYFDYTNSGLVSTFDWSYNNRFFNGTSTIHAKFVKVSSDFVVFNNLTLTGKYYGAQTPSNPYTTSGSFNYGYYDFTCSIKSSAGGMLGVDMFTFSSLDTAKQSILSNYDWVGYVNISDTYYIMCSDSLYSKYLAYNQGITAGAGTYEDGYNAGYSAGQTAGEQTGYQNGYTAGYTEGEGVGYNAGWQEGIDTGYQNGQNSVINHPSDYDLYTKQQYDNNYNIGYQNGLTDVTNNPDEFDLYTKDEFDGNYAAGYNNGLDVGEQAGYSNGYGVGYNDGETAGYTDGYNASMNGKSSFKDLMFAIVDAPFNVLSSAFDFEIFGINLSYFLITIVSLLLVAFVIRKLL